MAIVSRKSNSTNAVNYPLEDNQGSSSVLTDSSGTNLVRVSYNAFGLPRDGSDWDGAVPGGDLTTIEGISRRGYTGHSMLGRMGLTHMNGRVQDAVTGRFLSPDPTVPDAAFTQSYNRFAYVNNNPLRYIDPSGFAPDEELPQVDIICSHDWWCRFLLAMEKHCAQFGCDPDSSQPTAPGLPFYSPGGGGSGPTRPTQSTPTQSKDKCDAPAISTAADRDYSRTEPGYHQYYVETYLGSDLSDNSLDKIFNIWRNSPNAAPGAPRNAPSNTQMLLADFPIDAAGFNGSDDANWIYISTSLANRTWTNVTLPGHRYYPGIVRNGIVRRGREVYAITYGEGVGPRGWENEMGGSAFFKASQLLLKAQLLSGGVPLASARLPGSSPPNCGP